jgi:hypothetical protein
VEHHRAAEEQDPHVHQGLRQPRHVEDEADEEERERAMLPMLATGAIALRIASRVALSVLQHVPDLVAATAIDAIESPRANPAESRTTWSAGHSGR